MKKKKTIKNILAHTVLTLLAIVWVSPLVWIILTSFRAQKGAYTSSFFPKAIHLIIILSYLQIREYLISHECLPIH